MPYFYFRHVTSAGNVTGAHSRLSDPLARSGLNGNPNAIIQLCHRFNPLGGTRGLRNPHNVGVKYWGEIGKWTVFNLDGAPMSLGLAFDIILYSEQQRGDFFVHEVTQDNFRGRTTWFDRFGATQDPRALYFVTPQLSQFGLSAYHGPRAIDHPIGVWYNEETRRWNIYNQDGADMVPGSLYNVEEHRLHDGADSTHSRIVVSRKLELANVISDMNTMVSAAFTILPGDSGRTMIWITQTMSFRLNPAAVIGDATVKPNINPRPTGVQYYAKTDPFQRSPRAIPGSTIYDYNNDLEVYSEDGSPMPLGVAYNVHHAA